MAVNAIVPTLANPDVYRSEEDPELVRESLPFLLKTIESILDAEPEQEERTEDGAAPGATIMPAKPEGEKKQVVPPPVQ